MAPKSSSRSEESGHQQLGFFVSIEDVRRMVSPSASESMAREVMAMDGAPAPVAGGRAGARTWWARLEVEAYLASIRSDKGGPI
jgi:hypothetical protein